MDAVHSPVPELNLLNELQDHVGSEHCSAGFELTAYGDTSGLEAGWSKDPEFLGHLVPFGQATHSGSFYAIWRVDDRADLSTLPVVVFGDEGGQHVVARNLRELFQLLAYDSEIWVDEDEAAFDREEDEEHSGGHERYVAWLAEYFALAPADDPNSVVAAAQAQFGERFARWVEPFLEE